MSAYDIDPDDPIHRINQALSPHGENAERLLRDPEQLLDLLAYCDHNAVFFQGVIDRAAHRGFDPAAMMADAIATAEENETRANAADIERKFRLAPYRDDIAAIMKIWREERVPKSYAQQRYFGIQGGAVLRALEESLLAGGNLPRWHLERREKEGRS